MTKPNGINRDVRRIVNLQFRKKLLRHRLFPGSERVREPEWNRMMMHGYVYIKVALKS